MDSIVVDVPTHAVAVLRFASGVVGTLTASFDVWSDHLPHIEIYGTRGILRVPGPGQVRRRRDVQAQHRATPGRWSSPCCSLAGWWAEGGRIRGLGVADLADSLRGRPQRASAELGFHVLEVLESIESASTSETVVRLKSAPPRPEPVLAGDFNGMAVPPVGPEKSRGE